METYLDTEQAANHLNLASGTLANLRAVSGGPKFCRFGRAVRYRTSDLDTWAAARVVDSTSDQREAAA